MNDSRKGLEAKTKRELVALLAAEVREWPGDAPMALEQRASAEALTEMLGHCPLWLAETHWRSVCCLWLSRSARPDHWLRDFWLNTLEQWERYLDDGGFERNALPHPQLLHPQIINKPSPYPAPEPGYLPFGFVRPIG
jgi:hypothetical protein